MTSQKIVIVVFLNIVLSKGEINVKKCCKENEILNGESLECVRNVKASIQWLPKKVLNLSSFPSFTTQEVEQSDFKVEWNQRPSCEGI